MKIQVLAHAILLMVPDAVQGLADEGHELSVPKYSVPSGE